MPVKFRAKDEMKNFLTSWKAGALTAISVVVLCATAYSQPTGAVYSANIVGIQKSPVVQNLQLMSNPFEAMTIRELVGNSGVHATSEGAADNVILYDAVGQDYVTYYLRSAASIGYPEWRRGTAWATNVYVQPGQGFFYRSRLSAVRTNTAVGDVVLDKAVTNLVRPGLQLLSYPYAAPVKISDLNLKSGVHATSEGAADNLILYDSATQDYVTYYLRSAASIGYPEWRRGTAWGTNVVLQPGQSFFFRSRVATPYNWVEQSPYPDL